MGRLAKSFTRFPYRCTIYQMTDPTPLSDGEKNVVWIGRCRKESNTSVRTFKGTDNVLKGDYRVQLGALVGGELSGDADAEPNGKSGEECGALVGGLNAKMLIDVKDRCGIFTLNINDVYAGELGTTLYCDLAKT